MKSLVMKDVARAANVHISTVSLAFSGSNRIANDTKHRIFEIARSLGYEPDPSMKVLASYRRNGCSNYYKPQIAILFDLHDQEIFNASDYLPSIRDTAIQYLEDQGFGCICLTKGVDFNGHDELQDHLTRNNVKGILIAGTFFEETQYELEWSRYSLVKIHDCPTNLSIDTLMPDHLYSVKRAITRLLELGFKRPAIAVNTLDEAHTNCSLATGYSHSQYRIQSRNRIPPFLFSWEQCDLLQKRILDWMSYYRPDVMLSTWNNFPEIVKTHNAEHSKHNCVFASLHYDPRYPGLLNVINDYRLICKVAIDRLLMNISKGDVGIPSHNCRILVKSRWSESISN